MITKDSISDFFDLDAQARRKSWEALMKLSIKDRVRKRKAIQSVRIDPHYHEKSEEGHDLLRLTYKVNLSDFKEGDCLLLYKQGKNDNIKCTLYSFGEDNCIIVEVFPPNMPDNLPSFYDGSFVLEKDLVDLRTYVFYPFLCQLPENNSDFWNTVLFNTKAIPTFEGIEECDKEIKGTEESLGLELLPRQREAILKSLSAKDYYLIQGPPGTGKSFVLGLIILEEMVYFKHKVIVAGPNHMAINNALEQALKISPCYSGDIFKIGQSYNAPKHTVKVEGEEFQIKNILRLNSVAANKSEDAWVMGITPHSLYSSRGRGLECDTLIIDEAGQMSIPLALMGMIKAKKVILAGDHKQLSPIISSEEIPTIMRQSAFQSLMTDDNCTMLDVSFRMCEPICKFVSDLFYDGKLNSYKKGCDNKIVSNNPLYSFDNPVVIHHVDDDGEQTSDMEADFIANTVAGFIREGVDPDEIGILSPFRAQAANIRRYIKNHTDITKENAVAVTSDTVDKMQGQEKDVIIFSLTSGNLEYMKEMEEFLYSPHKLNVAFSRAKSKLIIVGNIEQIKKIDHINFPHISQMIESKCVKYI